MTPRQKYPLFNLRFRKEEAEERMAGEPRRIIEESVSRSFEIYKKTKKEKELLKLAKLQCKLDAIRK